MAQLTLTIGKRGLNEMLNHALRYAKLDISVIPLKPNGKEPLIKWREFQKRRATVAELTEWWTAAPNANIGIVTGRISNLAIVDLDGPLGLANGLKLNLQSPVVSITGRGKHLYYKYSEGLCSSVSKIAEKVDVRAEPGYVVAPPSIHENGSRYRWSGGNVLNATKLSPFPPEIFAELVSPTRRFEGKEEGWIAKALEEMKDGNIDDTLFKICSRMRSDGYTQTDVLTLLTPHAVRVGATPGHLEAKIENIWSRYEPRSVSPTVLRPSSYQESNGLVIHSPTNPDSLKQYNSRARDVEHGDRLQTGYPKLDSYLRGGLKSSRLFTVAARTGVGKTNWLLGAVRALCESGKSVLLFSTEMPYAEIWERYIQTLANPESFKEHKFFVCDSFAPNIEKVEEAINEIRPDVFMFDHINHVAEDPRELGTFMQGLNFLRRKYDTAGIISAQLNRSADWVDLKSGGKVTPRMSMIKGSGTIEQASSRVLLLSETRVTPEGTEIVGNLDKNDNGPKGLLHFCLKTNPYRMEEIS
jgi:Bifunctional DNA primase/polymerase, N-terminal/DnaB-like helicase C terminal domain